MGISCAVTVQTAFRWEVAPGTLLATAAAGLAGLLLAAIGRQWTSAALQAIAPSRCAGRLAIIIPVRNEAATVGNVVAAIPRDRLRAQGWRTVVVVVDDGSSDGSAGVARAAGAEELRRHPTTRGLGAALRTGLVAARSLGVDAAAYLDGDGEYDPWAMPHLLQPLAAGQADYVLGSRFRGRHTGMRWQRALGNRLFTLLMVALSGRWQTDAQTGYRAFSRRALDRAEIIHNYNYAQVLTLDLLRKGMRLQEVPIDYRARRVGESFIRGPEYCVRVLPAIVRQLLRP
ncbi:MAG: glycosyltransferase [Chloroflexi bacterium]|nr:glycosyltransferase [Chloroflexota bacterium]